MTVTADFPQTEPRTVHANGIDIHYLEAGQGEPLVLLHGGLVSTSPIWTGVPISYASHMATLSERFRVIAPDTRGTGRTVHSGGTVTHDLLADDVAALIGALDLQRPLVAGFSYGAVTATIAGIRHPGAVRAIVNHAGYDAFDPQSPVWAMSRQMFGGSPDATEADPEAAARFFSQSAEMQGVFELMKADEDSGQGKDYWREYRRYRDLRPRQPAGGRRGAGGADRRAAPAGHGGGVVTGMAALTVDAPPAMDTGSRGPVPVRTTGSAAADRSPVVVRPVRSVWSWPLVVLAAPAAAEVWSGWVGIAKMTGFGLVSPLRGSCCLIRCHAAGARLMRWRWVVRVRSRGLPAYQASSRITLMAVAAARCSRRVLPRPV